MLRVTTFDSFQLHSRNLCGYTVHTLARSRALPSQPVPISGSSAGAVGARLRGHVLRGLDAPFSAGGGSLWPSRHGYSSLHSLCLILFDSTPGRMICQGKPETPGLPSIKKSRYVSCRNGCRKTHLLCGYERYEAHENGMPIITGSDNARRDSAAPDT